MKARKLLALAVGTLGITAAAFQPPAKPLVDRDGRAAPGNVIGKGEPRPRPKPDGGTV
jgi:hypothetical protein